MYEGNIEDFVLKRHLGFYRGLMGLFHESFHVYQVCICEFPSILLATPGWRPLKKGFLRLAPHGQSDQSPLREGKKGEREERKRKKRKKEEKKRRKEEKERI